MKLQYLPPQIQNLIIAGAAEVLGESADMSHMLQKADELLKHDFPNVTSVTDFGLGVEDLEELLARAKWIKEFTVEFEKFFEEKKYPKKYWKNTLSAELSSWIAGDGWKEYSAADAAKSNISYWEV